MIIESPIILFESLADWEAWLTKHYADEQGVVMKIAKKGSGIKSITQPEALDGALCYGWIDGIRRGLDDKHYLQKYTPRRPKSTWSKVNVEKIAQLTATGRMQPSGIEAVEAAKKDGRWDAAYDSQKNMMIPDDFQAALDKNLAAKSFYETLNKTNTYAILFRLHMAKKPETRQARIEKFIGMLERGEKIHG
ncbi:MAG TPA: YdeI/OmpD-associated family protein [Candidatus Saccharimonadales bacterium]|nr:YdeI/OmpD-associated family protein [Candidatus Saccharimonadales bacterium]